MPLREMLSLSLPFLMKMNLRLLTLLVPLLTFALLAAPTRLTAQTVPPGTGLDFYPIVKEGDPGSMPYEFKLLMTQKKASGFFKPEAVITAADLVDLKVGGREIGAAPQTGLDVYFSRKLLTAHPELFKDPKAEYLIVFRGAPCADFDAGRLAELISQRRPLFLWLVPSGESPDYAALGAQVKEILAKGKAAAAAEKAKQ